MLLVRVTPPERMGRVMSVVGVPMILAPVVGPTLGGLLIDHAGWAWIFWVNLPIGIAAVVFGAVGLARDEPGAAGRLDWFGLLTAAAGTVGITYGLAEISVGSAPARPSWVTNVFPRRIRTRRSTLASRPNRPQPMSRSAATLLT